MTAHTPYFVVLVSQMKGDWTDFKNSTSPSISFNPTSLKSFVHYEKTAGESERREINSAWCWKKSSKIDKFSCGMEWKNLTQISCELDLKSVTKLTFFQNLINNLRKTIKNNII